MSPEPTAAPIVIRPATAVDWPPVWRLLEPAIRAGEVFYFPRDMTGEAARRAWFEGMEAVFVAVDPATLAVIGCYYLRTNAPAVHVWKSAGFAVVGTLPGAFAHPTLGYVDVYVMYRTLEPR